MAAPATPPAAKPAPTKAIAPIEEIRGTLNKMLPDLKRSLPSYLPADKFIKVAETAIRLNPDLLACDRTSLYLAVSQAAQDGLLPDKREGSIIKFGNTAVWMPQVGGICKKARNSGEISTIDAQVVCEHDEYSAWTDEKGQHFKHQRARGERGKPIVTYAYAITKDGGFYFEEIDETQMAAIKKKSKSPETIWNTAFADEMRRKSALRRLLKYRTPSSTDLEGVIERDDAVIDLQPEPVAPAAPEAKQTRLEKIVEAQTVTEPNEDPNVDEVPI